MKLTRREFAGSVAALLAGCGGGGGSGEIIEPPPIVDELVTLTPADGADGLVGEITLEAEVSKLAVSVQFAVDGVNLGAPLTKAPFRLTLDTRDWSSGQHVLSAQPRDAQGAYGTRGTATVRFGGSRAVPPGWTLDTGWVQGLDGATAFASTPDGRFLVTEQGGALRVVRRGLLLATPMLTRTVDADGERGLLGVAVHPDFATDGGVYVYYTRPDAGGTHNRIARFTAVGDVAPGDEDAAFDLPVLSGATNHNGGALAFGADGTLFVGVGDNADGAQSQDPASPFGKVLRLDELLGIPADNPDPRSAVWALGLRNPFTLAVQPGTGKLFINDVGQSTWEEIDEGAPGANYGWPEHEGFGGLAEGFTNPVFAYGHADASPPGTGVGGFLVGFAIAGGAFVPDTDAFPAHLRGRYLFADFATGFVAALDPAYGEAATFASVGGNPVGISVADDGTIYVLRRDGIVRIAQG